PIFPLLPLLLFLILSRCNSNKQEPDELSPKSSELPQISLFLLRFRTFKRARHELDALEVPTRAPRFWELLVHSQFFISFRLFLVTFWRWNSLFQARVPVAAPGKVNHFICLIKFVVYFAGRYAFHFVCRLSL
ncbi:hypothetical protein AABB24_001981, partial [Solanum stoloniferum]